MFKKLLIIAIVVVIGMAGLWSTGRLEGTFLDPILPDPPDYDPIDGIARVYGTIYDAATGEPLTFVHVFCGQTEDYTLDSSDYLLEFDITGGLERCTIMADKDGYHIAYTVVELHDATKAYQDFYLERG